MTEARIKELHTKKLQKEGWLVVGLIQTTMNGIMDKIALKDGRVVFLEYKRPGLKLEPLQAYCFEMLKAKGFECYKVTDPSFTIPEKIF